MKLYVKAKLYISRSIFAIAAFVSVCLAACILLACANAPAPVLSVNEIMLYVGDSRDIYPYIVFAPSDENRTATVSSSDECVVVEGTTVSALSAGRSVVSINCSGVALSLTVIAEYRSPRSVGITTVGECEQTAARVGDIAEIKFIAETDGDCDPDTVIEWSIDGERVGTGGEFVFCPSGYGEFTVRAAAGDAQAERAVRIYRSTETTAWYDGDTEQNGLFSTVEFRLRERLNSMNPPSVYEWSVNGEIYCESAVFDFVPPDVGEYAVSLKVNGKPCRIADLDSIIITARGDKELRAEVVFDDVDGVFVRRIDGSEIAGVSIISPNGTRVDIDSTDAQHTYKFDGNEFDASDYIEVCAHDPAEYIIITRGGGVCETVFTQYPIAVAEFLDCVVMSRNSFLSDEEDCAAWLEEIYACGLRSADAYVDMALEDARQTFRATAEFLGLDCAITVDDKVLSVILQDYSNHPECYAQAGAARMYSVEPHIVYDGRTRGSSYVFESDRKRERAEVVGSEQLLYAVRHGLLPICRQGSAAALIYSNAKNRLLSIIGVDWTDERKVHAIYDWLQWVTVCAGNGDVDDSSRYLESVFGSAELSMPETYRQASVTSEGCAKLFEFMCRIEGIESITERTGGGQSAYYRNKVRLGGQWYIVDVYGGRILSSELGISRQSELPSHRGLLISDEAAGNIGSIAYDERAAFDDGRSVYLKKYKDDGIYFDYYVDNDEIGDYGVVKAAIYRAFDGCSRSGVSVPGIIGIEMFNSGTLGCEFATDVLDGEGVQKLLSNIEKAVKEYAVERFDAPIAQNGITVYRTERIFHIIATIPRLQSEDSL